MGIDAGIQDERFANRERPGHADLTSKQARSRPGHSGESQPAHWSIRRIVALAVGPK